MDKYQEPFSEQRGIGPQWLSADPPISRVRALEVMLKHAECVIGSRGGPGLRMRAEHILKHARTRNLDARLYELAWFIERTTRADHIIISNETNPIIAGDSA
jgi:hypothetical protein